MLDAERRDPQVVLGNRLAIFFETKAKPCIHGGRRCGDVQDAAARSQPLHFDQVLGTALRLEFSAPYRNSPMTDNGKKDSFDTPRSGESRSSKRLPLSIGPADPQVHAEEGDQGRMVLLIEREVTPAIGLARRGREERP